MALRLKVETQVPFVVACANRLYYAFTQRKDTVLKASGSSYTEK